MKKFLRLKSSKRQSGVTMIEYALIAAVIAVAAVAVLPGIGTQISAKFTAVLVALGGTAP